MDQVGRDPLVSRRLPESEKLHFQQMIAKDYMLNWTSLMVLSIDAPVTFWRMLISLVLPADLKPGQKSSDARCWQREAQSKAEMCGVAKKEPIEKPTGVKQVT